MTTRLERQVARRLAVCVCGLVALGACAASSGQKASESPDNASNQGAGGTERPGSSNAAAASELPAPTQGTKALEKRSIHMDFDLMLMRGEASAGVQSGSWSIEEQRSLEVGGVEGEIIRNLAVAYGRREEKPLLGVERTARTAGHAYRIKATAGAAAVVDSEGNAVSHDEEVKVLAEYGWVGKPQPLRALLAEKGSEQGTLLEPDVEARRAVVGELSGIDPVETRLTLRVTGVRRDGRARAELEASGTATLHNGETTFELELKGPVTVDLATGWVVSEKLTGPVKATGKVRHKKEDLASRGKGTIVIERSAEF
jgi:hypothetical protein